MSKITTTLVDHLVMIAKEVESGDPIDWSITDLDPESTYRTVAISVLELYLSADKDHRDEIMLGTCIRLVVENMILNTELRKT